MKFEKPESDTWIVKPANEVTVTGALEEMAAAQSREYLTRVRDQHPGTPWAYLAERELREPLGWKWSEKHVGYDGAAQQRRRRQRRQSQRSTAQAGKAQAGAAEREVVGTFRARCDFIRTAIAIVRPGQAFGRPR